MKKEVRFIDVKIAELRTNEENDKKNLIGYPSVFNEITDLGDFEEIIRPGAFARAIRERHDAKALKNHDSNLLLGRVKNDTLFLSEDDKGLYMVAVPPNTQTARDIIEEVENGYIDQMSFAFSVPDGGDIWTTREDGTVLREIVDVDLWDVSVVVYPQYTGTSVGARSEFRTAKEVYKEFEEKRQKALEDENQKLTEKQLDDKIRNSHMSLKMKLRMFNK